MSGLRLFTSRYAAGGLIAATGLQAVGITKFPPKQTLTYSVTFFELLAPTWREWHLDDDIFDRAYTARLARIGATSILRSLSDVPGVRASGGAILLCFEDLRTGQSCHRRTLASFLESEGYVVPELSLDDLVDPPDFTHYRMSAARPPAVTASCHGTEEAGRTWPHGDPTEGVQQRVDCCYPTASPLSSRTIGSEGQRTDRPTRKKGTGASPRFAARSSASRLVPSSLAASSVDSDGAIDPVDSAIPTSATTFIFTAPGGITFDNSSLCRWYHSRGFRCLSGDGPKSLASDRQMERLNWA